MGRKEGNLLGEEREAGRKKLNTEGVIVDQHKRARQLKDGAHGGRAAAPCDSMNDAVLNHLVLLHLAIHTFCSL